MQPWSSLDAGRPRPLASSPVAAFARLPRRRSLSSPPSSRAFPTGSAYAAACPLVVAAPCDDGRSSGGGGHDSGEDGHSSYGDGPMVATTVASCGLPALVLVPAKTLAGCNIFVHGCNSVVQTLDWFQQKRMPDVANWYNGCSIFPSWVATQP